MNQKKPMDFYQRVQHIIDMYPDEKARVRAIHYIEQMRRNNIKSNARPSTCAAAIIYLSRGSEPLCLVKIVRTMRKIEGRPFVTVTESACRNVIKELKGVTKNVQTIAQS